jgi:hypothetical protein
MDPCLATLLPCSGIRDPSNAVGIHELVPLLYTQHWHRLKMLRAPSIMRNDMDKRKLLELCCSQSKRPKGAVVIVGVMM